jgi:hypothetical protein
MEGGNTAVTEKSEFEILVIKPNNISNLDFNNVNYITDILNNKCFESIKTNSEDIANIFASKLNPNNIENTIAVTNICYETYDKLYEICFLDIPEEEKNNDNYNNIASILDISKDTIFGNAILLKTNLPIDNNGMKLISSYKKDIRNILDARINHLGVFIDTNGDFLQMSFRDINKKLKELFNDLEDLKRFEIAFLKHNFTMYYIKNEFDTPNSYVSDIAEQKIYGDVFITSMLTKDTFTNISIKEVKQILAISKLNSENWKPDPKNDEEERDHLERRIIKSKFRILNNKYNELLKTNILLD